jgi:hypothetical protein
MALVPARHCLQFVDGVRRAHGEECMAL